MNREYLEVIQGIYREYSGIMEKKMEATIQDVGFCRILLPLQMSSQDAYHIVSLRSS